MNQDQINELIKQRDVAEKRARKLTRRIIRELAVKKLPELRKKYLDTYWIYENGMSGERWPLYIHCVDIRYDDDGGKYFTFFYNEFQRTTHHSSELTLKKEHLMVEAEHAHWIFEKKITKSQYLAALRKFKKQVDKLYDDAKGKR